VTYPKEVLGRPFGAESRQLLLSQYFEQIPNFEPVDAWKHVYRLLMWIDTTTSLAHCYESDKSQPGRHWYDRSLAFHAWLSDALDCPPRRLHRELDCMFKGAVKIQAVAEASIAAKRAKKARAQRAEFRPDLPMPTGDPDIADEIAAELTTFYGREPSDDVLAAVIETVTAGVKRENKRKNLLGEGFEDTLAEVIRRSTDANTLTIYNRTYLHDLPGFREPRKNEKPRAVDLAVVSRRTGFRTLATVKWSVRADREEQFEIDLDTYTRHEVESERFDFVFITNEFDAARLVAACERRYAHRQMFDAVVHVSPPALVAVHSLKPRGKAKDLLSYIDSGRLMGLTEWIESVEAHG